MQKYCAPNVPPRPKRAPIRLIRHPAEGDVSKPKAFLPPNTVFLNATPLKYIPRDFGDNFFSIELVRNSPTPLTKMVYVDYVIRIRHGERGLEASLKSRVTLFAK